MIELIQAKKGIGLADIIQRYKLIPPEIQKPVQTAGIPAFFPILFPKYVEAMLEMKDRPYVSAGDVGRMQQIFSDIDEIYKPDMINSFLQATRGFCGSPHYSTSTGIIVSTLIQQSYLAGNNNFELETAYLTVAPAIAYELLGKKGNPIRLIVRGDTGESVGVQAQDVDITIHGSARNLAQYAHRIIIDVFGNVEGMIGYNTFDSIFTIHGEVQTECIHLLSAHGCVIESTDRKTVEMLQRVIESFNQIIFVHPDGRKEIL